MNKIHKNAKDLTGQRFYRLTALEPTKERENGCVVWRCQCKCGNFINVGSGNLCSGNTRSCGCLHKEKISKRSTTHGMSKTTVYRIWINMLTRCENSERIQFKDYGGRGITVSEEFHDFQIWYEHIGPRPGPEYTQDRIENAGNYERGNIQWATKEEQSNNSRAKSCGPRKQYWFRAWHKDMMCQYLSNNQSQFAKKHNLDVSNISACLNGKREIHKKWLFQKL